MYECLRCTKKARTSQTVVTPASSLDNEFSIYASKPAIGVYACPFCEAGRCGQGHPRRGVAGRSPGDLPGKNRLAYLTVKSAERYARLRVEWLRPHMVSSG